MTELQGLLKESSDRYGRLEDYFEKEKAEHKEELKRRNDAIRALRKELQDANELIQTLKQRGIVFSLLFLTFGTCWTPLA